MREGNLVYKILRLEEWKKIEQDQIVAVSDLDRSSGFVHLSTPEQLLKTCNLYFRKEDRPIAIEIEVQELGEKLLWEIVATRENQKFPHLYRGLQFTDFQALQYLVFEDEQWILGKRICLK